MNLNKINILYKMLTNLIYIYIYIYIIEVQKISTSEINNLIEGDEKPWN